MKSAFLSTCVALSVLGTATMAGNLDRTKTPIAIIFENGNYAELTLGYAVPNITGTDALGNSITDVGDNFGLVGGAFKLQLNKNFALAVIYDQPYGADTVYEGDPNTTLFGGTIAQAEANGLTVLLGYNTTDGAVIFGGPRFVSALGDVTLSGLAYGSLNGYNSHFSTDMGIGYVFGGAYEIPDIAFRAALIYHSEVDLEMQTVETFPSAASIATGPTKSTLPQSVKFQVQSGIARDTLAFGSVRWSDWSVFTLDPPSPAPNLAVMDDAWTYEVGVGHQFTKKFSASLTYSYEHEDGDNLVSPLAPTKGYQSVLLGGKYQLTNAINVSSGVQYSWIGNAFPETSPSNVVRANFRDNDVISAGVKIGIAF